MVSGLSPAGTFSPIGFERLWRSSRLQALSASAPTAIATQLARKREDIEHASRGGFVGKVLRRVDEAEGGRGIARVELSGDNRTGPAANARDHCDVLAPVGTAVADRLPDDSAAGLEAPQELAGVRIDGFEPAVHRAVEHDASGSHKRWAPQRQVFLDLPDRPALAGVPGGGH